MCASLQVYLSGVYKGVGSDRGVVKLCVWGVVGVSESVRKFEGSQYNYG